MKSNVLVLACVFEKFIKVLNIEFEINLLYCVSLPGYTRQCGLKYTGTNLQTLQDKNLILTLEINFRGGISGAMGDCYVKPDENKKILYMAATNFYAHSMIQLLPYADTEMWHGHPDLYMSKVEEIFNTTDDSDIGYFIEVDLRYPDNIEEKTTNFPFCSENEIIPKDKYIEYMKKIKPKNYLNAKKLLYDWTDKKTI